jgi:hypothetical protein
VFQQPLVIPDGLRSYGGYDIVVCGRWGAGLHTQRLLASGGLAGVNIRGFIDSDPAYQGTVLAGKPVPRIVSDSSPKYQGKKLSGIAVESPAALKRYAGPVLISSRGFQREILRSAREQFGLANRFILLYEA